jgi:hypothetical protein
MIKQTIDAPIPGENYTSDTRNYPWHREADIHDYDDAVDHMITRMSRKDGLSLVYSLLELETPIATITSTLLLQAVSRGTLHIDMAIIIAGPVARHIEIFAKRNGMSYDIGADADDEIVYTPSELRAVMEMDKEADAPMEDAPEAAEEQAEAPQGLMAVPSMDGEQASEEEQMNMLGMTDEEETTDGLA